jgi:hypothetical protein
MPLDPELVAETRAWFAKALNDLRAVEALTAVSPPLFDESVFYCRQAAAAVPTFRKTHNLEEIGEQCLGVDPSLRQVVDQAVPLSEYAWKFRYPGEPAQPGAEEVAEALVTARAVFEAMVSRMPAEVRP